MSEAVKLGAEISPQSTVLCLGHYCKLQGTRKTGRLMDGRCKKEKWIYSYPYLLSPPCWYAGSSVGHEPSSADQVKRLPESAHVGTETNLYKPQIHEIIQELFKTYTYSQNRDNIMLSSYSSKTVLH